MTRIIFALIVLAGLLILVGVHNSQALAGALAELVKAFVDLLSTGLHQAGSSATTTTLG